jgi:hypothetical protein
VQQSVSSTHSNNLTHSKPIRSHACHRRAVGFCLVGLIALVVLAIERRMDAAA